MKLTTVVSQILCGIAVAVTASAQQSLTWDPGKSGGSGGTGTWDLNTTADWYNGTSDVDWLDNSALGANTALFGGSAGTVTLNSSLSASNLIFNTTGYTISGSGTLTLGAGGINASSLSGGTTTIGVALFLPAEQDLWQVGSGGTLVIGGTINRSPGGAVDFSSSGVTTATLTNDATGVIGGWATVGAINSTTTGDWAATNAGGAISAYAGYTVQSASAASSPNLTGVSSQNWLCGALNGANEITTLTNSVTIHSLVQQGDVQFNNGVTLTLGDGGLLLRGATSRWLLNVSGSPNSAYLTSGASTGELFVDVPGGTDNNWTIWPIIENNGATPLILVKNSSGLLKLGNMNTYTGGTIVNAGTLCATAGSEYGFGNAPTGIITPFGYGAVSINNNAALELGVNVGNAFAEYDYTNTINVNGGSIYEVDGFQHLEGTLTPGPQGVALGATYDNKTDGLLNGYAKGLFVDGPVAGTGPISVQDSGVETVNPWDSSTVYFTAETNAYSGTVTVNTWANEGGSYLFLIGTDALANATVNVIGDNSASGGRFGASGLIFGSGTNLDGVGYAAIGGLSGTGDIALNDTLVYSSSSGFSTGNPFALTVGGNNTSTTYSGALSGGGSLNKIGTGTLTLSGTETYTGNTTVSGGRLALTTAFLASTNIIVGHGATLDVSALGSAALASGQDLLGGGTINGSVTANSGSEIYADSGISYGTNIFNNNLTLNPGALVHFSIGTLATGSNDLIIVSGALTANNNTVHISAPSSSAALQAQDYTLLTSANPISGTFAAAPSWDVAPANAGNFSIVTSGNTVKLHYTASTAPTGGGSAAPNPAVRNQNVLITVTTTNGTGGTVNSVVVNASAIGGSSSLALVNSGGNVWTGSVIVSSNTPAGSVTLMATITDTASLNSLANIPLNIILTNRVWNGAGGSANWGNGQNWTDAMAPGLVGDSVEFAGTAGLSPNMDSSYTIAWLLFDPNAGAFNLSSGNGSVLTVTGGITNNSPNAQTLNMVLAGTNGLTTGGGGALNLTANETYTGNTVMNSGTLNISGNIASASSIMVGASAGSSLLNLSGAASLSPYYLLLGNAANSVAAVYQMAGTVNADANSGYDNLAIGNVGGSYGYYDAVGGTLTASGVCIAGEDNTGSGANFAGAAGNGIMDVQNGANVNDTGWFVICRNTANAQTGILNVYTGGSVAFSGGGLVCNWGSGQTTVINDWGTIAPPFGASEPIGLGVSGILNLETGGLAQASVVGGNFGGTGGIVNFNGGTVQAINGATYSTSLVKATSMYSYSGGATFDENGDTVTNSQPLLAPSGDGIYSASVTSGGAGYIAPPIVTIVPGSGDTTGAGATAIAQVNPVTGTVTGIIITCPGQNYTATPTFALTGGGGSNAVISAGAPQPNVSGGLTVVSYAGGGQLILNGVNTYTGATVISNEFAGATLALAPGGSIANSTNIATQSGCVLDVTALSSFTLANGQTLAGLGNVNGSVTAAAGSYVSAGQGGTLGVNTFNNNLTFAAGAAASLALSTAYNGNNDQIVVSGSLTANNNVIHLSAPSTSSSLDTAGDYVLITAGSISGAFASAPVWDVAPVNAGHYSIVTSGTTVTLHYSATVVSPTVTATLTPSTVVRNQPALITATVTPGSSSIATVTADFSPVGGSMISLVESNSSNIYTNSAVIPPSANPGSDSITVTVTDTANQSGSVSVPLTVVAGNDVWNGAGGNANWSTALNWASGRAPGYVGDSVEFGGTTQLAPNMDTNYTVTGIKFDANAGSFNIGSANSSTLTLSGSAALTNGSANNQTLNVTVADSGGGFIKSGGPVTLAANNTYIGPTIVQTGVLNVPGGIVASNAATFVGNGAGNSVLNVSGNLAAFAILAGNSTNSVGAVYQTGGNVWANAASGVDNLCLGNVPGSYGYYDAVAGTSTFNGISIGGEDNNGTASTFGLAGNAIMDINSGATVNDPGWLVMARNNNNTNGSEIAVLNMYGGYLTYAGGGLVGPWDKGESAIINVMGGVVSNTAAVGVYLGWTNYEGILNLNGGVLQASVVQGYNGPSYAPVDYGQLNFNGGTLQASAASSSFILVNGATIYSGGATINNNSFGITVSQALTAPTGKGVHGIASFTGGAGYIAPPIVTVTNGAGDTTGTGATAIAQINPVTGTVTNIIITCPGVNYTAVPVFIVSGGGATSPATITGAAPTADVSGGLTATGSGTLTLTANNTYTGGTVVNSGTLALSGAGALASTNINVSSASATFDVSGVNFTLGAAQSLTGVGTVNGNVTNNGTIMAGTSSATGILSFNNALTLKAGGTTVVKLNPSQSANDEIYCFGNLTYGGTLQIVNLGGTLQVGNTFQVFFTGASSGNFAGISGSPGPGLAYSFNPSTGVITVVTASASITGLKFTASPVVSGANVAFSVTNTGAGTVYMLTTTNLAPPITWTPIWTNVLGGSSAFTTNLAGAVIPGSKQQFFILSTTN